MKKIEPTIEYGQTDSNVHNLQDALLAFLEREKADPQNIRIFRIEALQPQQMKAINIGIKKEADKGTYGDATKDLVLLFQTQQGIGDRFGGESVDDKTASLMNEWLEKLDLLRERAVFAVVGTVTDTEKAPQPGMAVRVFSRDLRKEELLGEAKTDEKGNYRVELGGGQKYYLTIRAFKRGSDKQLAESKTDSTGEGELLIDLVVSGAQLSEWERITNAVLPLLKERSLSPAELESGDLELLAEKTGIDYGQLRLWTLAFSSAVLMAKDFGPTQPPAPIAPLRLYEGSVFEIETAQLTANIAPLYGWFTDGRPQNSVELLQIPTDQLMASLESAVNQNYIPVLKKIDLKAIEESINQLRIERVLKPASEGSPASIGDVIGTIDGTWVKGKVNSILDIAEKSVHTSADYFDQAASAGFTRPQAVKIRQAMFLGDLTQNNIPLMKALQPQADADKDGTLKSLVSLMPNDWLNLAYEHAPASQTDITPENYASDLQKSVEDYAPHAALITQLGNKSVSFTQPDFAQVEKVLAKYKDFDIKATDIEKFAEDKKIDPPTAGALGKLRHLKNLGTTWDEAAVLANAGLEHADLITRYGKSQFKEMMKEQIDDDRSDEIYNNANILKGVSIGLMGYAHPLLFGTGTAVMADNSIAANKAQIDSNPTLRKLFGALDGCACDPCMSVLSPAAYLADLLKYVDGSSQASRELERRRPDIYDLELSCDNTKAELPHIDLGIEILENAVALPCKVELPPGTMIPTELFDGKPVGANVMRALGKTAKETLGILNAVKVPGGSRWIVKDLYRTWAIEAQEESFGCRNLLRFIPVDLAGMTDPDMVATLNSGNVPLGLESKVSDVLSGVVGLRLPIDMDTLVIMPYKSEPGSKLNKWEITFTLEGDIVIDKQNGTLFISEKYGRDSLYNANPNLLTVFEDSLNRRELPANLIKFINNLQASTKNYPVREFEIKDTADPGFWKYKYTGKRIFEYRAALIDIVGLTYQSTPTDRNLFVKPQNSNPLAYEKLAEGDACFPWSLPYDQALNETRETLNTAGTSRLALMETVTPTDNLYSSLEIAKERLGLSNSELNVITTSELNASLAKDKLFEIWGLKANRNPQKIRDTFVDQEITSAAFGNNGLLTRVSIILQQSGLSYAEFDNLLQCEFINPGMAINVSFVSSANCMPSEMRLNKTDEADVAPFLDRFHRFVRLWRSTDWDFWELDLALFGREIGNNTITENTVIQIANLKLLKERLDLPVEALVSMFCEFSGKQYSHLVNNEDQKITGLYDRLFQNRGLSDPPKSELAFLSANAVSDATKVLVAASAGLSKKDFDALIGSAAVDSPKPDPNNKNVYLQWVFRNSLLQKTLGLSVEDYILAWQMIPSKPFTTLVPPSGSAPTLPLNSPAKLLRFMDEAEFVMQSGFSWDELSYLLMNIFTDGYSSALGSAHAANILSTLQAELRQVKAPDEIKLEAEVLLTDKSLQKPDIIDAAKRYMLFWNLTEDSGQWLVKNPANGRKVAGTPLELLSRIDVLTWQSGLSQDEVIDAIGTTFVSGEVPLRIKERELIILDFKDEHLLALEHFILMLRESKLKAKDLGALIQAFASTGRYREWELNNLIDPGIRTVQMMLELQRRLDLSIYIIADWWINARTDDSIKPLAESLGVDVAALNKLIRLFTAETNNDPFSAPEHLLKFVNASRSLMQRMETVHKLLSQAVSLDRSLVETILFDHLQTAGQNPRPAIQYLISDEFRNNAIPEQENALANTQAYKIISNLYRFALLNARWDVKPAQTNWLNNGRSGFTGLNLNTLSVPTDDTNIFVNWKRTSLLFRMAKTPPEMGLILGKYFAASALGFENSLKELEYSFGPLDSIKVFAQKTGNEQANFLDPIKIKSLCDLLSLANRLAITPDDLGAFAANTPGQLSVEAAYRVLGKRFRASALENALRKVSDAIRIQKRDRLVDYLLAREGLRDANALYEYYLIDFEMAPCMNTTRMLQSTAAVQLFVQRCFLNLERPRVEPQWLDRKRWEWTQNYRVWEANRKVFLYPENWLFPEVRDDSTETFRSFENILTQNEPSHSNALTGLRRYLDDLADVGQISVVGMYEHFDEQGTGSTLYLVGRLLNAPNVCYWRKAVNYGSPGERWTGWERADLEVSSDHVIPFVFEGDFHIAWPVMNTVKIKGNDSDEFYEVKMSWARKTSAGWAKRRTSRNIMPSLVEKPYKRELQETFAFRLVQDQDLSLAIQVFVQLPISKVKPPLPPPSRADVSPISQTSSITSQVFWSLDIVARNINVQYQTPEIHSVPVKENQYQLIITGVVKEGFNHFNAGLDKVIADIKSIINNYKSGLSDIDKTALDFLIGATLIFAPFTVVTVVSATHPMLAFRIRKYLYDPIYRITGKPEDTFTITREQITLFSDRMISFGAAQANEKKKAIGISCVGVDQALELEQDNTVEVPFSTNLPDGVPAGAKQQVNVIVLFKAQKDSRYSKPEVPLQMQSVGSFRLRSERDDSWESPLVDNSSGKVLVIYPLNNTRFWSNGFQENNLGNLGFIRSGSNETLWVIIAYTNNPQRLIETLYVEEGGQKLLGKVNGWFFRNAPPPGEYNIFNKLYPAGFSEALLYRKWEFDSPDQLYQTVSQTKFENPWFGVDSISAWIGQNRLTGDPRDNSLLAFDLSYPNANYNWELFYHLPIAAAMHLSRQHRFEDARKWFHFVFDPTTNDPATGRERFWRFLPFRHSQAPDSINQILAILSGAPATNEKRDELQNQINAWLADPFSPFAVARMRPSAFEWYTVTGYIKNLIDWADQLFRRDTRESINEATLLYVMAAQILGPRPEKIRAQKSFIPPSSYRTLASYTTGSGQTGLGSFSNVWIGLADNPFIKAMIEFLKWIAKFGTTAQFDVLEQMNQLESIGSLYFKVPVNEKLPELWDMVEDRLFKVRHCQNIEGVTRSLALYEPPIDPEILIRAKAAGVDIADILADLYAPVPLYRFQVLLQKAQEFCGEVKNLGGAILSAIEKKEAEHLALLRSSQELEMLKLIQSIKEEQIKETQANIDALTKTRSNTLDRFKFLQIQLGNEQLKFDGSGAPIVEQSLIARPQPGGGSGDVSGLSLISNEVNQLQKMQEAQDFALISAAMKLTSGIAHAAGAAPAPYGTAFTAVGHGLSVVGDAFGIASSIDSFLERRAGLVGGWQRRRDEWVQQSKMTAEEIRQIDKQIIALEVRRSIAEKELDNHRKQIEHASNIDDYMRHLKFSGESLYSWMESQLSGLYFSAYQMAYEMAKKAERSFQFELGDPKATFVQYGNWDSMRKGLLSGERLSQHLRRMETAHLERNKRELEITKHISLRQLNPIQLMMLRATGECEIEVPEMLFDLDFPGHYFRRIKSVSVSVPCVVGPYSGVSGTLTLLSSKVRHKTLGNYSDENNFMISHLPTQSIATSTGQNDAGVFEFNFRDERYLPFEGAGAISKWKFKLPEDFRSFDYDTISDLILHFRYTARDSGSDSFVSQTRENTKNVLGKYDENSGGFFQFIDLRHDFPSEWHRYNNKGIEGEISLDYDRFPFVFRGKTLKIRKILHQPGTENEREVNITGATELKSSGGSLKIQLDKECFSDNNSWIVLECSL